MPCNTSKPHATIKVSVKKIVKDYKVGSVLHADVAGALPWYLEKTDIFSRL